MAKQHAVFFLGLLYFGLSAYNHYPMVEAGFLVEYLIELVAIVGIVFVFLFLLYLWDR